MKKQSYLITAATGDTGSRTARELLAAGAHVRVLVHRTDARSEQLERLGAEVAVGDLLDFDSVRAALRDIQRAYFCFPIIPGLVQATAQFVQAVKENGLEFLVNLSQKTARPDSESEAARQHWLAEQVLDWAGVPHTHLRPTLFAEWLLYVAPTIRAGVMRSPFSASASGRLAPIAAEDEARVIAAILQNPAPHVGKTYPLYGPTELTYPEIAAAAGRELGKPVTYEQISVEDFGLLLASAGGPSAADNGFLLRHLEAIVGDQENGLVSGTNAIVKEITGREPMSIEQFVHEHRGAFA
jgi:NAD(P)H dehydrogenase (quinone)